MNAKHADMEHHFYNENERLKPSFVDTLTLHFRAVYSSILLAKFWYAIQTYIIGYCGNN